MTNPYNNLEKNLGNLYNFYIYYDGEFVKGNEAKISIWDHGFLYGDGFFEGIRLYGGNLFKLTEHLNRLYDSANCMGIEIPLKMEEIQTAIIETIKKNKLKDGHIRPIITRGVGGPGLAPKLCSKPSIIIMAYPLPPLLGTKPASLITCSITRKSPHSVDPRIKSLNYLDNVLAKMQAANANVDDAIMLDHSGYVAECSGENIFLIKNKVVKTPTTVASLGGITRDTVIDIAKDMNYEVLETHLVVGDLYTADEVFVTGSAAELCPIGIIDGRKVRTGSLGKITEQISKKYKHLIYNKYLTPVYD